MQTAVDIARAVSAERIAPAERIVALSGITASEADVLVRTLGEETATELCLRDLMERVS